MPGLCVGASDALPFVPLSSEMSEEQLDASYQHWLSSMEVSPGPLGGPGASGGWADLGLHPLECRCLSRGSRSSSILSRGPVLAALQKMVGSHPPVHILSALEHLALQRTQKLQELTDSIDIPKDVAALK